MFSLRTAVLNNNQGMSSVVPVVAQYFEQAFDIGFTGMQQ